MEVCILVNSYKSIVSLVLSLNNLYEYTFVLINSCKIIVTYIHTYMHVCGCGHMDTRIHMYVCLYENNLFFISPVLILVLLLLCNESMIYVQGTFCELLFSCFVRPVHFYIDCVVFICYLCRKIARLSQCLLFCTKPTINKDYFTL